MKKVSEVVAYTLKHMKDYARPSISTKQLDNYGAKDEFKLFEHLKETTIKELDD